MSKVLNSVPILGAIALISWVVWGHSESQNYSTAAESTGEPCIVKPGSVHDGDTLQVICDRKELKIRMCGIDAPEIDQPGGIESRDYLRSLLPDNQQVAVIGVQQDQYGRTVAEIWNDNAPEPFINGAMVLAKQAWHYERYSGSCPNGSAIAAASSMVGLPPGVPPWEFRQR